MKSPGITSLSRMVSCLYGPGEENGKSQPGNGEAEEARWEIPWESLCFTFERVHANDGNQVLVCMEVCKQWQAAVQATVTKLKVINCCRPQQAVKGMARFEALQSLRVEDCYRSGSEGSWADAFQALGTSCPDLEAIHFVTLTPLLNADDTATLFRLCSKVQTLELKDCTSFSILPEHDTMTSLKSLTISDNQWLQSLPYLHTLSLLTSLNLIMLRSLPSLPHIDTLSYLRELNLSCCYRLKHLPPLGGCLNLETLNLYHCTTLNEVDVTLLHLLKSLIITGCRELWDVHGLKSHKNLETFLATECDSFRPHEHDLTSIQALKNLAIDVGPNPSLLPHWESLPCLRHLGLATKVRLPPFGALPNLEALKLDLDGAADLPDDLEDLSTLRSLVLDGCSNVEDLDDLDRMSTLRELQLSDFAKLDRLPDLTDLTLLEKLFVENCILINEVPSLDMLVSVTRLDFSNVGIKSLPPLDGMPHLSQLQIYLCPSFTTLPPIAHLPSLSHLYLVKCGRLQELPGPPPPSLLVLDLSFCPSLVDLPSLDSLHLLQDLTLNSCLKLRKLPHLTGLRSLRKLSLQRCEALKSLPSLGAMVSLRVLDLLDCTHLDRLPSLRDLKRLRLLDITGCPHLSDPRASQKVREEVEVLTEPRAPRF